MADINGLCEEIASRLTEALKDLITPTDGTRQGDRFKVIIGYEVKDQNAATWPRVIVRPTFGSYDMSRARRSTVKVELRVGIRDPSSLTAFYSMNTAVSMIERALAANVLFGPFVLEPRFEWTNFTEQQQDACQCVIGLDFSVQTPQELDSVKLLDL